MTRTRGASSRSSPARTASSATTAWAPACRTGTRRAQPTVESETRVLAAVLDACGEGRVSLFACSCAGVATARLASLAPERVEKLVFFGSYVSRADVPEATRRSMVDFVRTNWPLAAQMLAGLMLPRADGDAIEALSRYHRHSATAEVAAAFLHLDLTADAREFLPDVETPTLVLHRRGDRTVPISHGREVARLLPNARFVAVDGDAHVPVDGRSAGASPSARRLPRRRARPRGERRLSAQPARDRGPEARRRRPDEPRDRVVARPQRAHGPSPRRQRAAQARPVVPCRGRRVGDEGRAHQASRRPRARGRARARSARLRRAAAGRARRRRRRACRAG